MYILAAYIITLNEKCVGDTYQCYKNIFFVKIAIPKNPSIYLIYKVYNCLDENYYQTFDILSA